MRKDQRAHKVAVRRFIKKAFKGKRAGIFLKSNGHYIFGVDRMFREITDFGGQINLNKDRDIFKTAIREFREETSKLVYITPEELHGGVAYFNRECLIIQVNKDLDNEKLRNDFLTSITDTSENMDILILTEKELCELLHQKPSNCQFPFYELVRDILAPHFPVRRYCVE